MFFCGRSDREVSRMFTGIDGSLICDICVDNCYSILESMKMKINTVTKQILLEK